MAAPEFVGEWTAAKAEAGRRPFSIGLSGCCALVEARETATFPSHRAVFQQQQCTEQQQQLPRGGCHHLVLQENGDDHEWANWWRSDPEDWVRKHVGGFLLVHLQCRRPLLPDHLHAEGWNLQADCAEGKAGDRPSWQSWWDNKRPWHAGRRLRLSGGWLQAPRSLSIISRHPRPFRSQRRVRRFGVSEAWKPPPQVGGSRRKLIGDEDVSSVSFSRSGACVSCWRAKKPRAHHLPSYISKYASDLAA